jgi:hypothetical protein
MYVVRPSDPSATWAAHQRGASLPQLAGLFGAPAAQGSPNGLRSGFVAESNGQSHRGRRYPT